MRPYYEAVAAREGIALVSIPIQFAALVAALAAKLSDESRDPPADR
jgi:hypothetical protein